MLLSETDRLISDYEGEKIILSPSTRGIIDRSYEVTGAIMALNTLKSRIEKIKVDNNSDTSASDFSNEVINEIKTVHQIMRGHTLYPSGNYQNARPGVVEALDLVEEYIPRLEEHWLDRR